MGGRRGLTGVGKWWVVRGRVRGCIVGGRLSRWVVWRMVMGGRMSGRVVGGRLGGCIVGG